MDMDRVRSETNLEPNKGFLCIEKKKLWMLGLRGLQDFFGNDFIVCVQLSGVTKE